MHPLESGLHSSPSKSTLLRSIPSAIFLLTAFSWLVCFNSSKSDLLVPVWAKSTSARRLKNLAFGASHVLFSVKGLHFSQTKGPSVNFPKISSLSFSCLRGSGRLRGEPSFAACAWPVCAGRGRGGVCPSE